VERTSRKSAYAHDVAYVARLLSHRYHDFDHDNRKNPLDELLFIICSRKTNEPNYASTYRALRRKFPRFESLAMAPRKEIAKVIAPGGLSNQKSIAISGIMDALTASFGKVTLSPLRSMSDEQCERFLISLPWVGKKTARCVMMYSLGRKVFPVDTHCWRVSRRLDWIRKTQPDGNCSSRDMDRLQTRIPPFLRYSLHVNMVSLGRQVCTVHNPKCHRCPTCELCAKVGVRKGIHRQTLN
jgi:endonuclease III